jgi:hypothetical protein
MVRYHAKSLFRDFLLALRRKGPWFEVSYHAHSLWSEFVHPARRVVYGVRNLFAYLPIIWHDRDWDYSCMLDLWEFKFKRMAHLFEHYGHHVGDKEQARNLRMCAQLCARIRDDEYADIAQKAHDEKWGKMKMVSLPKRDPNVRSVRTRFIREGVFNDATEKQEREEFSAYFKKAEQQRANDLKYLGEIIATYTLHWWD